MITLKEVAHLAVWGLFFFAYGLVALFCIWWFPALNPMIPRFEVVHSEIPGSEEGFSRPGSFEVRRVFENDRRANGRVCAYMQRRAKAGELVRDGQFVVPDTGQYEIGCADTVLSEGRDPHDRFWQLPLLPAGDYVYVSKLVFPNPLRSHEYWLPPIPIKLK